MKHRPVGLEDAKNVGYGDEAEAYCVGYINGSKHGHEDMLIVAIEAVEKIQAKYHPLNRMEREAYRECSEILTALRALQGDAK